MYQNLAEMLNTSCRKYWWRKAVLADKRTIRYFSLKRQINRVSGGLFYKLNLRPHEKVALLLGNSDLYPIMFFSILKTGAIVIPLNTFLKAEELRYIIDQCDARILITSEEFYTVINEVRPQLKKLTDIILVNGNKDRKGCTNLCDIIKGVSTKDTKSLGRDVSASQVAVIIYTSGTTGYPKGAMLTHKNLLSNIESSLNTINLGSRDRILLVLPMFHSFTMTVCMLMPLAAGGGMVVVTSLHPFKKVFRRMLFRGVTIIVGIPPLYELLAKAKIPWLIRKLLRIRLCISGAAPLSCGTLKRFEENWMIPLLEGYGLSETSPVVSLNPMHGLKKSGSVGLPIYGVDVRIVGPDEGELPVGEEGEIIVKGDNVMEGYYKEPKGTKDTIRGGWLFTGDIGKVDEDGYIYIVDRKKDMILVRGLNVYPREVENVLMENGDIQEVSVIGRPDQSKGEVPVAFVVPKEGQDVVPAGLMRYCRKRLADYKVPRQIFIKTDLPRTPTGKILKRELRRMLKDAGNM